MDNYGLSHLVGFCAIYGAIAGHSPYSYPWSFDANLFQGKKGFSGFPGYVDFLGRSDFYI
jgi:hypothetical protein